MSDLIVSASPEAYMLGIDDQSRVPVPSVPEAIPTHLPYVWTYASTGPETPTLVQGASLVNVFGQEVVDSSTIYGTHQTELIKNVSAQANAMMVKRVRPTDAGPNANARLWIDVLTTTVPDYKRNSDGSYQLDDEGNPIPTGTTIPGGATYYWGISPIVPDEEGNDTFGLGTQGKGGQTDATSQTQSTRYPIFDFAHPYFGQNGNLTGLRFTAPTVQSSQPVVSRILANNLAYPFRLTVLKKDTATQTASIVSTQAAETSINFCLKPGVRDLLTTQLYSLGAKFPSSYQLLNSPLGLPNDLGPVGRFFIYQNNIDALLQQLYAAEIPFADQFSDFDHTPGEFYRFNFFTGVSSQNVPYHSFIAVQNASGVRLTDNGGFYLQGGSDGTMNETLFAQLVSQDVKQFADPLSVLNNTQKYPVSRVYDSGFPLQTKYDLMSVLALRKDIMPILCTHDVLGPQLTASEESSLAVALRTRLLGYPESDYFGTGVCRGMVIGRSGTLLNSLYTKPLPLLIEFATKAANYEGASNGIWKPGQAFNVQPLNQVTMFADVNVDWTPATVRNQDWANGLVWVESYGTRALYWPAFKTVYGDDTSVLTSYFTVSVCTELEKVGKRAHIEFVGRDQLTQAQFSSKMQQWIVDDVNHRFDSRFQIVPEVYFTTADTQLGYAYHLRINVYANNLITVGTINITARRMSDFNAQTVPGGPANTAN